MDRALVKGSAVALPPSLAFLLKDPPLVGEEKREDYENLFWAIAAALKPSDEIVWLLALDFTDLMWESQRERKFRTELIKLAELEVVSKLLAPKKPSPLPLDMKIVAGKTDKVAKQWAGGAEARQSVIRKLAKYGYDAQDILTLALKRIALQIEAIDRRKGGLEFRRLAILKAKEQYSEASARKVVVAADVIEGEYTEAEG